MEKQKITKNTTLGEVVSKHPQAVEPMLKRGMHCVGCHVAAFETVEQGAKAHGMKDKEIEEMLKEMNSKIKGKERAKSS